MFGYDELRAEQKRRRDAGDPVQLGHRRLDVHRDVRPGAEPGARLSSTTAPAAGSTRACGCCRPARSRSSPAPRAHGQGHETAFSQIVADRLGVAFEDVEVLHGDTQVAPKGYDTYGSRSLVVGGEALVRAADKVIEKAKPIAAHLLEASVDDLEFTAGRFSGQGHRPGHGDRRDRDWPSFAAHNLPDGVEATLDADATYDPVNFNFPHGTHLCAMEVDTETGEVKMRKYVCCRRHRQHHQPADRRRAGARRPGAGHRAGAVGGGGVRRRRHAGVRVVRRLPAADRGRHDQLRHRPHHVAVDDQHARHQGRRRGRHHRLDPGRGQRDRRRGPPLRRQRHPDAVHARAGVAGDQRRRAPVAPTPKGRRCRTSTRPPNQEPTEHGRSRRSDPRTVRLPRADLGRGGAGRARRARRRRQGDRRRPEPAAGAADAAQRARGGHRPRPDRRRCAASATTATRS